jgi:hypothetical protein
MVFFLHSQEKPDMALGVVNPQALESCQLIRHIVPLSMAYTTMTQIQSRADVPIEV